MSEALEQEPSENQGEPVEANLSDDVDYVPIDEFSDEEVSKLLKEAIDEERSSTATPTQGRQSEEHKQSALNGSQAPKEAVPPVSEESFVKAKELPNEVSKEEYEKLKRRLEQQETFLRRRSTEIGELRKQLKAQNDSLLAGLKEKSFEDPASVVDDKLTIRENERAIADLNKEEANLARLHRSQQVFYHYVPPEQADFSAMAAQLESDGAHPEVVSQFRQNPFATMTEDGLIQLARRTSEQKVLAARNDAIYKMSALMKKLIDEREANKKAPSKLIADVEASLKAGPSLNGRATRSTAAEKPVSLSDEEIDSLSDDELKDLRKRMK